MDVGLAKHPRRCYTARHPAAHLVAGPRLPAASPGDKQPKPRLPPAPPPLFSRVPIRPRNPDTFFRKIEIFRKSSQFRLVTINYRRATNMSARCNSPFRSPKCNLRALLWRDRGLSVQRRKARVPQVAALRVPGGRHHELGWAAIHGVARQRRPAPASPGRRRRDHPKWATPASRRNTRGDRGRRGAHATSAPARQVG